MSLKFTKKNLLVTILIISIAAISVVVAYHFYFKHTPQGIVKNMTRNMQNIQSFHYQTDLIIKANMPEDSFLGEASSSPSTTQEVTADINASGDVGDLNNNPKLSSQFGLNLVQKAMKINLAQGEMRGLNKTVYFRLNKLLEFGILHLDRLENKWFKIDLNNGFFENDKLNTDYKKLLNKIENNISSKQKKQLRDLTEKTDFFVITNVLPDENINGVSTYHYAYRLDSLAFKKFLSKARDILNSNKLSPKEESELNKVLTQLSNVKGEMWIGKKNNLLYKLIVNYNFILDSEKNIETRIKAVTELSQFDKGVDIGAPEEAQSLESFSNLIPSLDSYQTATSVSPTSSSTSSTSPE